MSFQTMTKELLGDVPGLNLPYARTLLNRALLYIYDLQRWSFQVTRGGWLTPGLLGGTPGRSVSPGTITIEPFFSTLAGDATAVAAWSAIGLTRPLVTERQIRAQGRDLYNIIAFDPDQGLLTLDRPWMEPAQVNAGYMMYQAYFPVPDPTFRKFGSMRDMVNNARVDYKRRDQSWLERHDPQRMIFDVPTDAIPYGTDQRAGSATLGQMMYELWPHPLTVLPYAFNYLRGGPLLSLPLDTVPYPLTEELVLWRAKELGYLWKESQKGDGMERGSGADWRFLTQDAHEQFTLRLKTAKLLDVELGDLYWNKFEREVAWDNTFVTSTGVMGVGAF